MQSRLPSFKAGVFQAPGHGTRIAIVEMLMDGAISTGAVGKRLGAEQANVSQHLAVLRTRQILASRKEGNQVFYSVRNPILPKVLDIMRDYFQTNPEDNVRMLDEIAADGKTSRLWSSER